LEYPKVSAKKKIRYSILNGEKILKPFTRI
jgi:hypothetical protein